MMAPTLYMTPLSPPSRAVLITASALGIDLKLERMDLSKGEHRKADYIKLNPLHAVPTLEDDGVVIIDSHAINAYLVRKYAQNDDLYPRDFAKRALVDQALHFDTGILFNHFRNSIAPIFYRKTKVVPEDQTSRVVEAYGFLEKFLEQSSWISGESATIADFSLATTATSLNLLVPIDGMTFPKVVAWLKRFEASPWSETNKSGLEELKAVIKLCTT